MRTKWVKGLIISQALIILMNLPLAWAAQTGNVQTKTSNSALPALLEKSGYSYSKVSDGIYEIPATGSNLKEFGVRVTEAGDLILFIFKFAGRSQVTIKEPLALKLLQMNDDYDVVKFALSGEMLYARIDVRARLFDVNELKSMVELMAHVVDEAYPQIKPFIK